MNQKQLDHFRSRLIEMRVQFADEIANLQEATDVINQDSDFGVGNHMADEATDIHERETNLALIEDRQQLIDQVDAALERLASGTYGICVATGVAIPLERLEALPYAALSVEAQAQQERHDQH